ncbi:MAG: translocation/assembly module TamB domain-containing protein, partial [Alphaproteobacteria bacterium]
CPRRRSLGARVSGSADAALVDGWSGRVPFDATAWGRPGDVAARVVVKDGGEVRTPAGRVRPRGTIDLSGLGGEAPSAKARLAGGVEPIEPAARVFGPRHDVDLSGAWSRTQGAAVAGAARDQGEIELSARAPDGRQQLASLRFERAAGATRLDLGRLRLAPTEGPAWTLERPSRLVLDASGVEAAGLALRAGDARLALDGRLALAGSDRPGKMTLDAHGVDAGPFCALAGGRACGGRVDARVALAGTASRPEVSGRVAVDGLALDGQDVGRVDLALRTDRGLVIDGSLDSPLGGRIDLGATLPLEAGEALPALASSGPLSVRVRTDDFDVARLRGLAPPDTFSDLRGRAKVDVSVGGTPASPRITGEAIVPDLSIGLAATGLRLRRARVALRFAGDHVEIAELSAEDGKVTGSGRIELPAGSSPRLDVTIGLDRLKVYDKPIATASATGSIHLLGTLAAPEIEGDVVLDPVTIRPSLLPGQGGPRRDPTIVVWNSLDPGAVRPGEVGTVGDALAQLSGEAAASQARESATYRAMRLSLRAVLGREVAIRRNDADIRLSGEVWATKSPGDQVRLTGHVDSGRGWYVFQGRRLELEHAWVTFSGEDPVDPYVNVAAVYRDAQVRITVSVQGTARKPSLELSSEPSLPQSDILAMLLFGKPASELSGGQGQGLQQEALGLLASYVAPGLERSVIDTFGLTSLTFQVPSGAGAGSIGIGRYLGDDVFVSISQDLGGTQIASTRQQQGLAGSAVVVQYYLSPSVTIQGSASSQGESAIDAFWHARFGGGARPTPTPGTPSDSSRVPAAAAGVPAPVRVEQGIAPTPTMPAPPGATGASMRAAGIEVIRPVRPSPGS